MHIVLYIAISSDGFIADKNGDVGWLDQYNSDEIAHEIDNAGCGFKDFYNSIDALIIGNNTYKQVLTFGPWAFSGKTSYIFTDEKFSPPSSPDTEYISTGIASFIESINSKKYKRVWLMGGAQLAESFYKLNLIDEIILTILPTTLNEGISLNTAIVAGKDFNLIDTKTFNSGIIQKYFLIK